MAIIIGVVLCHQNGWLGFGSHDSLTTGDIGSHDPGANTALGSMNEHVGNSNRGINRQVGSHDLGNRHNRLTDVSDKPQVPVQNVVQIRNPDASNVIHGAGVFGIGVSDGGRPRSISGAVPGNRPIQFIDNIPSKTNTLDLSHSSLMHGNGIINNSGQPNMNFATHINPTTNFQNHFINSDNVNDNLNENINNFPSNNNIVPSNTNDVHSNNNNVHSNTNNIPSNKNNVNSNTNIVPSNTNNFHSNTNIVPSSTNNVHSSTNIVPSNANNLLQGTATNFQNNGQSFHASNNFPTTNNNFQSNLNRIPGSPVTTNNVHNNNMQLHGNSHQHQVASSQIPNNVKGVPLPILINPSPDIPVPALITPTSLSQLPNGVDPNSPPDTIHVHDTIFFSDSPISPSGNPFSSFTSSFNPITQQSSTNIQFQSSNQNTPSVFKSNSNSNKPQIQSIASNSNQFGNEPAIFNSNAHVPNNQQHPSFPNSLQTVTDNMQSTAQQQLVQNQNVQPSTHNVISQSQFTAGTKSQAVDNTNMSGSMINQQANRVPQEPKVSFPSTFVLQNPSNGQTNSGGQEALPRISLPKKIPDIQLIPGKQGQLNIKPDFELADDSVIQLIPTVPAQSSISLADSGIASDDTNNAQINKMHMEKMKMLKEILDAEGSGKLLQDLITLKNNKNSLAVISQHLSEVSEKHGPSPSLNSPPPQRNLASVASPAVLHHQHRDSFNRSTLQFTDTRNQPISNVRTTHNIEDFEEAEASLKATPSRLPQQNNPPTPKPKSNIQMVRELLASLVNSPEVQEILNSRNRQAAVNLEFTGREISDASTVKGEEVRSMLLKALAKEMPDNQNIQRLRLHGQQQSSNSIPTAQLIQSRGEKPGKITRAEQVGHFDLASSGRIIQRELPSRRLLSRMGPADTKKQATSIEHQSIKPPVRRRTSRGRPTPNFSLKVETNGNSEDKSSSQNRQSRKISESVDIRTGDARGEIVRHWRHMDNDGTVSQGTVRKDGSFAFTNCRPAKMCQGQPDS